MAYSRADELAAQDKLAQIWQVSDRSERIALAERFDYGGTDASKLRAMRRLINSTVGPGQYATVTPYFKDYVTADDPLPWEGDRLPPFQIDGNGRIMSQIMYVRRFDDGTLLSFEVNLNAKEVSSDVKTLFEAYNARVKEVMGKYSKIDPSTDESGETLAIAFSQKGVEELIEMFDYRIDDPRPTTPYGIVIVNTRAKYVGPKGRGRRLRPVGRSYQRSFPRAKRDDIIRYANQAYGQYRRKGGRLA